MTLVLTTLAFITWLFNVITDGFMVALYWNRYPQNIALVSTICFGMTVLISLCVAAWAITKLAKRTDFPEGILSTWKNAEAVYQSLPQLLINLYALSSCDAEPSLIQVASASTSLIGVLLGLHCIDVTGKERPDVKGTDLFVKAIFFSTKMVCISARIFIIVCFTFYLNLWTSLFLAIHSAALLSYGSYSAYGKAMTLFRSSHIVEYCIGSISLLVWFQFIWLFDESKKWSTLGFSIFYFIENMILLAIASFHSFNGEPYCLYENVFIVHALLNLFGVALALMYCMKIWFSERYHGPLVISDQAPVIQLNGH